MVECTGGSCGNSFSQPNIGYIIAFSTIYYFICFISFVQLVLCVNSEFKRQKPQSLVRALKITTQKAVYFFICLAAAIRGIYFSSLENLTVEWSESLISAYYPVLLSGSSLIVCFWAELFHLHDVSVERPRFLSKSFTGFILFNVVTYSLFLAELVLLQFTDNSMLNKNVFLHVINSIYALLILVVVTFFLIYGVEIYFKLRGAFIKGENHSADVSQLHQSRFGLISQAVLLCITVLFIISDVFGSFWKEKVPVLGRNTHQVMFRLVEIGVALWYPCVLWNCIRPEKLWILNPRRILKRSSEGGLKRGEFQSLVGPSGAFELQTTRLDRSGSTRSIPDCWICYDSDRTDAGSLIQPCSCIGDLSVVHHECLKTWLMESSSNPDLVKCKVCKEPYKVSRGAVWLPAGLTISHWFQTAAIVSIMCSAAAGACLLVKIFEHVYVRTISVGVVILIEYVCLRLLGFNILSAYNRARFSSVHIGGRKLEANISENGNIDQESNNHQEMHKTPVEELDLGTHMMETAIISSHGSNVAQAENE